MNDSLNLREPSCLHALWADTRAAGFPMASEQLACSLLRTLASTKVSGNLLELGSGTGLSTAWLLDGMDKNSKLMPVDSDEAVLNILSKHLGNDLRLSVFCADGDEFISSIQGQRFDLIFADTWAGKYRMLQETLDLLKPGGMYVVGDMLPQPNWPEGHSEKASELVSALESDRTLKLTKLSWASGIIIATKMYSEGVTDWNEVSVSPVKPD